MALPVLSWWDVQDDKPWIDGDWLETWEYSVHLYVDKDGNVYKPRLSRYRPIRSWYWGRILMWLWIVSFIVLMSVAAARW